MEKQAAKIIQLTPESDGTTDLTNTLTIDKLKSYEDLHDLSDEQAQEALFAIQALAGILYEQYLKENRETGGEGSINHQQAA
jgi:hypothetical protein